uniref:C2H2-type domain-containing protein n=1 Tax=Setaria digitata TaxID=48799 RepID=A0A915PQN3_9BILA
MFRHLSVAELAASDTSSSKLLTPQVVAQVPEASWYRSLHFTCPFYSCCKHAYQAFYVKGMATPIDGGGDIVQNGNLEREKENVPKDITDDLEEKKDSTTSKESINEASSTKGHNQRNAAGRNGDSCGKNSNKENKPRSKSTNISKEANNGYQGVQAKRRYNSVEKTRNTQRSTNSMTLEGFDYDGEIDLEEPFSDSDDNDALKGSKKLTLTIPRGRIRTLSGTVPAVGYSPKWGGPTMCLSCLQFFDLPEHLRQFSEHLLDEHHIVIVEIDLIVDPKRYVEYWRQRFAKDSIDTIFPKKIPDEDDELYGRTDFFYEMGENLPEDYALRQKLAMRRLEEARCLNSIYKRCSKYPLLILALACQQREREDTNFIQQCIFCRYTARVFVTEYIECLKSRLLSNECIYCEKKFSDRNTLMDHMRKRNHKEVNPKNNYYDKFYIINYLELGKRWLDVLKEDFEDTMPTFVDSDEEEEEESWQEWQEDNIDVEQTRVVCLFCEETEDHAAPLLEHIKIVHNFDILGIIEKDKLDIYERMKMINYIRKENYNAKCFVCGRDDLGSLQKLRQHYAENNHLSKGLPEKSIWCTEENLVPIFGNDHLTWMLESYIDEREVSSQAEETTGMIGNIREYLLKQSEVNSVEGVIPEDLPELHDGALTDLNLYESLK